MDDATPEAPRTSPGAARPDALSGRERLLLILFGLLFLAAGARAAYWVASDGSKGFASLHWRNTTGVVIRNGLEHSGGYKSGREYSLVVVYRYTIAGREYENHRISFPETRAGGDRQYFQRELDTRYPVGGPLTVYYDPRVPSESCLQPGVSCFFLGLFGLMAPLMSCIGLGLGMLGIRGKRSLWGARPETSP